VVAADLKFSKPGYAYFYLITLFKLQHFDHGGWKPNGKAVPPLRHSHADLLGW